MFICFCCIKIYYDPQETKCYFNAFSKKTGGKIAFILLSSVKINIDRNYHNMVCVTGGVIPGAVLLPHHNFVGFQRVVLVRTLNDLSLLLLIIVDENLVRFRISNYSYMHLQYLLGIHFCSPLNVYIKCSFIQWYFNSSFWSCYCIMCKSIFTLFRAVII